MAFPVVDLLEIVVDRTCSGGVSSPVEQGGPVDLPAGGYPARLPPDDSLDGGGGSEGYGSATSLLPLDLAVWVDHSVIEAYALGGHGRVTSRIYPLDSHVAWGVIAWAKCEAADVKMQAEVHEVDSSSVWDSKI
jgi:hypothetical protein